MGGYWKNRKVFVTGATGLLGSALVETLAGEGADVVALIRDRVSFSRLIRERIVDRVTVVQGAVEDYLLLERVLNEHEIEVVFHLAAQTIVGIANTNPLSTFEANIKGSWCLFEACRRNPAVKRIVVASSDKAYGIHDKLPYDEESPLSGSHPYDVSKSCADLIAQTYYHTYDLPVCITRCGNLYGPGDLNYNRIVPGTVRSVLLGESPVIRSDGTFVRDYFYVYDAVSAYIDLAEQMERPEVVGEAFNFSNQIQISVLELVEKILRIMKSGLKPRILNQGGNEIPHQYLSAAKAGAVLGWSPRYTLEEGLEKTVDWYKSRHET
ncbi:MAG: GDP-mannose 4,6-dehydratase [bacterium]